jgi:hypothetical protein
MKHLKPYKIFESDIPVSGTVIDELRYISLDIKDDGFNTNVSGVKWDGATPTMISVFIDNRVNPGRNFDYGEFYLCEVSQCIQQMIDYMKSEGFKCEIYTMLPIRLGGIMSPHRSYLAWQDIPIGRPMDKNCLGGKKISYVDMKFIKQ